ncbi:alpha/beta hydrolase family protein [Williamwhitmania taraxaci]|uniref:Pimeloyl-ACP methyl ester carboxylesterase n=1 Tax=Williamwhitmania taraxaci TaxID=1640674 RepID=A0A1G6U827_9BACT|nr:alpha/beta hydrolase [Williamwhitmania taraxaci]SDD37540.1 Pimeloyl-ACP methyl ester carboxylesterase [Williamwhitmania taraxaci]
MNVCKKTLLFLVGVVLMISGKSQARYTGAEITKAGFTYICLKDSSKSTISDSIRFVVNISLGKPKPLLLFIQGSGNGSIIFKGDGFSFSLLSSFTTDSLIAKYTCVLIGKPFTALVSDMDGLSKTYDTTQRSFTQFQYEDCLSYYVKSATQVLEYMAQQPYVDSTRMFVVGHSQGYAVAAKLAADYPRRIKKVACLSAGIFDRQSGTIMHIREQERGGIITHDKAQEYINAIYEHYSGLKQYVEEKLARESGYAPEIASYMNSYSFDYEPALNNLLKIRIPLLVIYGTNDLGSLDNDLLPLFFTRAGKVNLTMKCYPGYDHNFFSYDCDSEGKVVKENFNWPEVFLFVSNWLQK